MAIINRESLAQRIPISSITPEMVGVYFALFWIQCVAGIAINAYNQIWLGTDVILTDVILQMIAATGPISFGAAANSFIVAISTEGIMVMAAWVKKRQFRQGLQQGREEGRAEERERANAKLRAWAKDAMEAQQQGRPIPFDQLLIDEDTESEDD